MSSNRTDVHIHICAPSFHSPSSPPLSTPASAHTALDALHLTQGVLSCCVPGPASLSQAQKCNEENLAFLTAHNASSSSPSPSKLRMWASTPPWTDVPGTLSVLQWARTHKVEGVVGVVVMHHGLGEPRYAPVWEALHQGGMVLFVHPTFPLDPGGPLIADTLPPFIADFPLQTTRAMLDLAVRGVLWRYDRVRVVVPHAGGAIPVLADKVIASLGAAGSGLGSALLPPGDAVFGAREVLESLKGLYFDVALSTGRPALLALLEFVGRGHVLWGSDCTLCTPTGVSEGMMHQLDNFLNGGDEELRELVWWRNADRLFQ